MIKRKIALLVLSATLTGIIMPSITASAEIISSVKSNVTINRVVQDKEDIKVSRFDLINKDNYSKYEQMFKVDNIKSYSNNGGVYDTSTLDKAFDSDRSTHWETGTPNENVFTNEVIVTFEKVEEINRIVYSARQDAWNKGYATNFSIYASLTENDDDFELVGTKKTTATSDYAEFKFENTRFKRLKFVFNEALDLWASASEFMFFKEDKLTDSLNNIFKDGTQSKLAEGVLEEDIIKLEELLTNHPFKSEYTNIVEEVRDLYENPNKYENDIIITASQRGDADEKAREHQVVATSYSLDTFGRYVTPGETIKLYVDADEEGIMPSVCLGQIADNKNGWTRFYTLKPGLNTITAPSFDTMNPAVIYIYNPAKEEEQAFAPRVRLVGGTSFPVYRHGETDPIEYAKELEEYVSKVSTNNEDFANGVRDDVFYNITELVSENNTISTSAKGALQGIKEMKEANKTVEDTMNDWEKLWYEMQKFSGFVDGDEDPRNDLFSVKFTSRVFTDGPYGWSDWGYTGYNGGESEDKDIGFFKDIVKPFELADNWAYFHEWGHSMNNYWTEDVEVTNNLYAAYLRRVFNLDDDRIDWNWLYSRFSGNTIPKDFFTDLGILSQPVYYFGDDTYGNASRITRTNPDGILNGLNNNLERLVISYSFAVGYDLTEFFNDWNYCPATDLMKEKVSSLPKLDVKLEYMHTSGIGYKGTGFTKDTKVSINSIVTNAELNQNTLMFSVDEESLNAAMGYEIFRNGELVGYTVNTGFVDKDINADEEYVYEIVAYDKKLNESNKVSRSTSVPNLQTDSDVVLNLYDEFNVTNYISAVDNVGNDLSSKVEIVKSDLDMSKRGNYTVEVQLENNGEIVKDTLNVKVVSSSTYVSDMDWKSSSASYDSIKRDKSYDDYKILLSDKITKKVYSKGLGMHAVSEVVVDIEDKGFTSFESYVGIDENDNTSDTSVNFQVYVDNVLKYDTGKMTNINGKKHISVDVTGAKEVKLVMSDAGNGKSYDRGVWADTKFTKNTTLPVLNVEDTSFVKLHDNINLLDGVTATDVEDGNITSNIIVDKNSFNPNKAGEYFVSYKVNDSDNNTIAATRKIVVYSKQEYLSDIEWEYARADWGTVNKDLSVNGIEMKLGVDGKTTTIEKGIGIHANGEVIYNLEGTNYEYFESLVGVDRSIDRQDASSIVFKVFADGEEVFNSGLMKWNDEAKLIRIPVKGVSNLKIAIYDGNDGDESDHGCIGNAKFFITNSKPELTIPSDVTTKLGEGIDLNGECIALDAEDGDITYKVEVTGNVDFKTAGCYEINYTVIDSDGNKTVKTRKVKVVDMDNYEFLSDVKWKEASAAWGEVTNNLSISGKKIRLTNEDGQEVVYEKGIGTHATSTIIYDLTQNNYGYFTSFIGVDREMYGSIGSISFEVYLDGEKVYDSGLMNSKDTQKFVEVNLRGAKEMKLVVTDGGNDIGSDHASFGNAKLHYTR